MFAPWFLALCPAVGVGLAICAFTQISMAHYNQALIFGVEVLAIIFVMGVTLIVVHERGTMNWVGCGWYDII